MVDSAPENPTSCLLVEQTPLNARYLHLRWGLAQLAKDVRYALRHDLRLLVALVVALEPGSEEVARSTAPSQNYSNWSFRNCS